MTIAEDICAKCEYAHKLYTHHCGLNVIEDYVYCEVDGTVKHSSECTCLEEEE
ncbi:hypothetical protein [Methanorbis rubei]|uniref:Uncharacterized protein n=1 Tax=Methanorbis rubei TaxID=3028300 RepID=A0AAE4MH11_9EURY|nr:hypothetical protein [Methanocorpusculaceae archaeon Cs1]